MNGNLAGGTLPDRISTYMRADRGSWCLDGLRDLINELPSGLTMVEVGVFAGESTRLFVASGQVERLFAVDTWNGEYDEGSGWECPFEWADVEQTFRGWAQRERRVVTLNMSSLEAAHCFADGCFDFVYIDAGHAYQDVHNDILAWAPKIKPDGWLGGHDFSAAFPGVQVAVRQVASEFRVFKDTSWLCRKADLKLRKKAPDIKPDPNTMMKIKVGLL